MSSLFSAIGNKQWDKSYKWTKCGKQSLLLYTSMAENLNPRLSRTTAASSQHKIQIQDRRLTTSQSSASTEVTVSIEI